MKIDLALNNLQKMICYKENNNNQPTNQQISYNSCIQIPSKGSSEDLKLFLTTKYSKAQNI